ncbi:DUF6186 family protein [Nocardia mexicana]|uniref:Uncharacterized protein n=1 Tax=Nocardia mexicana TaxID=279262 RepID=A0A370GGH0_9NOCA|nr:DUF6186 family protein [Nocardia mexicana]RDI42761.1 hypothetical protein DFR68_12424 [Nocardia mexicana]
MSERAVIITGFAVLFAAVAVTTVVARVRPNLLVSLATTIGFLTRTRSTRLTAVALWAWLGWHFLAR